MVCLNDHFLLQDVILSLSIGLHKGIHIFVIGGIVLVVFESVSL